MTCAHVHVLICTPAESNAIEAIESDINPFFRFCERLTTSVDVRKLDRILCDLYEDIRCVHVFCVRIGKRENTLIVSQCVVWAYVSLVCREFIFIATNKCHKNSTHIIRVPCFYCSIKGMFRKP